MHEALSEDAPAVITIVGAFRTLHITHCSYKDTFYSFITYSILRLSGPICIVG